MASKKEDQKKMQNTQMSLKEQTQKPERLTTSSKANLMFPVARVLSKMRAGRYADRISTSSAVGVAAVLEYLTAELLELAGDKCFDSEGQKLTNNIKPRHITLAIREDEEINKAIGPNVIVPMGGVIPFIHKELENTKKSKSKMMDKFKDDMAKETDYEDEESDESD